jgi:hypothetical protein
MRPIGSKRLMREEDELAASPGEPGPEAAEAGSVTVEVKVLVNVVVPEVMVTYDVVVPEVMVLDMVTVVEYRVDVMVEVVVRVTVETFESPDRA